MGLFDIFKRKKKPEAKKIEKKPVSEKVAQPLKNTVAKKGAIKKGAKLAYKVLESPHVTEKASDLAEKNKYSFKVSGRANKSEIKKAVEELYGVNVIGVSIINIHKKKKRVGRTMGFKKGYKKAIIEIKKGQSIEVMPR